MKSDSGKLSNYFETCSFVYLCRSLVRGQDMQAESRWLVTFSPKGQSSLDESQPMAMSGEIGSHAQTNRYRVTLTFHKLEKSHQFALLVVYRTIFIAWTAANYA